MTVTSSGRSFTINKIKSDIVLEAISVCLWRQYLVTNQYWKKVFTNKYSIVSYGISQCIRFSILCVHSRRRLQAVKSFKYLGPAVPKNANLDSEIISRMQAGWFGSTGKDYQRFSEQSETYNGAVRLYGAETWAPAQS